MISVGLNSLQQKEYQISVKIWIFDDPIPKKGPILVILVPVGMKPSKSGSFLRKKGIEAIEVFEARKIINEFFRVNLVLAFDNLMTNIILF